MSSTFEKDIIAAANAATRETNVATYKLWLEARPRVVPCEANDLMFQSYMDFEERELTSSDFDFAFGNLEDHLALQRVPTPQEIVDAENKHRRKLALPQLHELARKEHPAPTRGDLPNEWYGADTSTAIALRTLAKNNLSSFKALCERFGTDEVNKRLGVVAAKSPYAGNVQKISF
jgi:hypothetical protein